MKVGIVLFSNIRYSPFLYFYTHILDTISNVEYRVLFFNRNHFHEEVNPQLESIDWVGKGTNQSSKLEKLFNFARFSCIVEMKIKREKFDFLIVLTTFPGVLISKALLSKYKGRYLLDIRDYTHESNPVYRKIEEKVVDASALNIISSPGFVNFLPKSNYLLCHNFDSELSSFISSTIKNSNLRGRPIRIAYIGSISYESQCKLLIDLVLKDDRFEFYFYGNEDTSLKISKYVHHIDESRIKIMGGFMPKDKKRIYEKTDLVFNCYGNQNKIVRYAISNKYYDGAKYRTPVLVSPNTEMEKLCGNYGFTLDLPNLTGLDGLYSWFKGINWSDYNSWCIELLSRAEKDNSQTASRIVNVIKQTLREKS